jgi:phospholipid/cholesterol/gamma-HCH transport system substrate-binding protein
VRDLRQASADLSVVTPHLTRSFKVLNSFFNTLAYNPPGATEPFLYWSAWGAHAGATLWALQDAHGPVRRGIVLVGCSTYNSLEQIVIANPQLGVPTQLLNLPSERDNCPNNPPDDLPP